MIPIIVIGANDYAEYTNSEKIWVLLRNELPYVDSNSSTQSREEDRAQNAEITQLRDKVLELLHEEASELCYENAIGCIIPACFQIYLKDIIEKAKGEKK